MKFFDYSVADAPAADELRAGLLATPAVIAPKHFYDALGSRLFEAICELHEYTLPRDERAIFDRHTAEIAHAVGPGCTLVDLGAGNCEKAERLFGALRPVQYVAVDIAGDFLRTRLVAMEERHPGIEMIGIAQDFTAALRLPPEVRKERRVLFYPGSSIGNFGPQAAVEFLRRVRLAAGGGHLLLGADLVKDAAGLVVAYDDALGVTAAFNLNVLLVVNRLAGTDFAVTDWRHVALYNEAASRIEMHLEARRALAVRWPGSERRFAAGERIHTENSYKWEPSAFEALLREAGFGAVTHWTDARGWFSVFLAG